MTVSSRVGALLFTLPVTLTVLAVVFLLAFATHAITPRTSPSVAITGFDLWHGMQGRAGEALEALCQRFNAEQADYRVRCIDQGDYETAMQKAIASYRANKHPAIVQFYEAGTLDVLMSGAMIPVSDVMHEAGYSVDWQDYLPAALNYYSTRDGQTFALPFNVSTVVLYANSGKLRRAGVPEPPRTWEAFSAALVKLRAQGETCPFAYRLHPWWHLEQFSAVHDQAVSTLNNGFDGLDTEYRFDRGLHARFMGDLKRWHDAGLAVPLPHAGGNFLAQAFAGGRCAMVLESTAAFASIRAGSLAHKFNVEVSAMPHYADVAPNNTLVGGAALWVMRGFEPKVYSGVASFIHFLQRPEIQIEFSRLTGFVPVTGTARGLLAKSGQLNDPAFAVVKVGIDQLSRPGSAVTGGVHLGYFARFRTIWIAEMEKAFAGRQTIDEALQAAKRRGDRLLRRFERVHKIVQHAK